MIKNNKEYGCGCGGTSKPATPPPITKPKK